MDLIAWLQGHWDDIIKVYLQFVGLMSVIVRLTPTDKDNKVFTKLMDVVGKFGALNKKPA
jgi:hypothetical protein